MMVIAGTKNRLAFEVEVREMIGNWIFGGFRIWADGQPFGNWEDAADLGGIVRWMSDLAENPRDRTEPSLELASKADIFRRVADTARAGYKESDSEIPYAFSRFSISQIGMSALNAYDVLLVETENGQQRLLWRQGDDLAGEEIQLPPGEAQRVAGDFAKQLKQAVSEFSKISGS